MQSSTLKNIAGFLWIGIGLMLCTRGWQMIGPSWQDSGTGALILALLGALLIGGGKGFFVIRKSARRYRHRLENMAAPIAPWKIFPIYFYPLIAVMIFMGKILRSWVNDGTLSALAGGAIYIGIGIALLTSAFGYWDQKGRVQESAA